MPRFYFDIRDGGDLYPDEEGMEFPDLRAAEAEAAESLASLARDRFPGGSQYEVSVEVRTAEGPLFKAAFIFETREQRSFMASN
jgi:hypothetical protein